MNTFFDRVAYFYDDALRGEGAIPRPPLGKLAGYYQHLTELAQGYEKDPAKLNKNLRHVYGWRDDAEQLSKMLE